MSNQNKITVSDKVREWLTNDMVVKTIKDALAGWMDVHEFMAQVLIALNEPKIRPCTPESKFEAMHKCASLQLLPTIDQVAFIPYENKHKDRDRDGNEREHTLLEVEVTPQWQGYKAIMERHPAVIEVEAEVVFEGELYHFDTVTRQFHHEFDPFENRDVNAELDNIKGAYLRIIYSDDRPNKFHFVTRKTIVAARSCAKTPRIWNKFPKQMVLKTAFRDGYSRRVIPIDPLVNRKVQTLLESEDRVNGNDPDRVKVDVKPLSEVTEDLYSRPRINEQRAAPDLSKQAAEAHDAREMDAVAVDRVVDRNETAMDSSTASIDTQMSDEEIQYQLEQERQYSTERGS